MLNAKMVLNVCIKCTYVMESMIAMIGLTKIKILAKVSDET